MKKFLIFSIIVFLFHCKNDSENKIQDEIYFFEKPDTVITGTISKIPYIEDDYNGLKNKKKYFYLLILDKDLTVNAQQKDNISQTTKSREVHVFSQDVNLDKYIDKKIKLKGSFFFWHTRHHRRPLMFKIENILQN